MSLLNIAGLTIITQLDNIANFLNLTTVNYGCPVPYYWASRCPLGINRNPLRVNHSPLCVTLGSLGVDCSPLGMAVAPEESTIAHKKLTIGF